ncbi:MAG: ketoacyl reductase, partial [Terriglobia bacterium]
GREGIIVSTIVPGLMRTGSHVNAVFKGRQQEESAWFGLSASLPLISMNAERAAREIVRATRRGDAERTLSLPAFAIARLQGLFPASVASLLSLVNQLLLPKAETGEPSSAAGKERYVAAVLPLLERLLRLGQAAAERYNQL